MSEPGLPQELDAHVAALRDVASKLEGPDPDFADAVERARAQGSALAVPELPATNAGEQELGSVLALFVDSARERAGLVEHEMPRDPPSTSRGRRGRVAFALGIAACAAGVAIALSTLSTEERRGKGANGSLAQHQVATRAAPEVAAVGDRAGGFVAPTVQPALAQGLEWTASQRVEKVGGYVHRERVALETTRIEGKDLDREIARLDAAARERWRAGDLVGAERLFREAILVGGRRPAVDVIYGDVILLARQLGGSGAQAKAWRQYLRRFPSGRFADDARAGLCRRAEPARDCWLEYLRRHPEGAHRDEAARAASK